MQKCLYISRVCACYRTDLLRHECMQVPMRKNRRKQKDVKGPLIHLPKMDDRRPPGCSQMHIIIQRHVKNHDQNQPVSTWKRNIGLTCLCTETVFIPDCLRIKCGDGKNVKQHALTFLTFPISNKIAAWNWMSIFLCYRTRQTDRQTGGLLDWEIAGLQKTHSFCEPIT